jgi:rSAM/selenodomain-associated transferase 2
VISIVIPTLNESVYLADTLQSIFDAISNPIQIIVVDGGSIDNTVEIATKFGVQVLLCGNGRSYQMNAGAAVATGDTLIFLHGDTLVPIGFDRYVEEWINLSKSPLLKEEKMDQSIAGAFNLKINSDRSGLRWVEWGVKVRSKFFNLPYGDQALFLKTSTFHELGGFPELPIMEDFVFVRSLLNHGKITIVPASVTTSARRWEQQGILKTTIINQIMILGYYLGISPDRLKQWYRSTR